MDVTIHGFEHSLYYFTVISPLVMLFMQILWFPLMLTMPLFTLLWMQDYFYYLDGTNQGSALTSAADTVDSYLDEVNHDTPFRALFKKCYTDPFKLEDNMWESNFPLSELQPRAGN